MNSAGVFDEQTDFSFLDVTEQKSSVASKNRKDRSVQLGDVRIDIQLTYIRTDEWKAKQSKRMKGRPGHKHTAESKAKISAGNKGKKISPEQIELMRQNATGKKQSEQTVKNRIKKVMRPLMTPNGIMPSRQAAYKFYNCSSSVLWLLMKADIGFYDLSGRKETVWSSKIGQKKPKKMMTPAGEMPSRLVAEKFFNVCSDSIYTWMREYPEQFYYITEDSL